MKEKIRRWYEGEYIPYENEPGSGVFVFGGHTERHWTATAVRWAVSFYMREWKWTLGAAAALIGALVFRKF